MRNFKKITEAKGRLLPLISHKVTLWKIERWIKGYRPLSDKYVYVFDVRRICNIFTESENNMFFEIFYN